jgi:hypothetical protein
MSGLLLHSPAEALRAALRRFREHSRRRPVGCALSPAAAGRLRRELAADECQTERVLGMTITLDPTIPAGYVAFLDGAGRVGGYLSMETGGRHG